MELHFRSCHTPDKQPSKMSTHWLPFTLLPPGTWDIRQVVEHYRKAAHDFPTGFQGRDIDMARLEKIKSLNPVRCYIGKESWHGYVVFEFKNSQRVVLECPIEGNATYILSGNWKAMVYHTKAELRQEYANRYTKVVHKGAWLDRIRQALR
jgi:hypothetical protein